MSSSTGAANATDFDVRFIAGCAQLQSFPAQVCPRHPRSIPGTPLTNVARGRRGAMGSFEGRGRRWTCPPWTIWRPALYHCWARRPRNSVRDFTTDCSNVVPLTPFPSSHTQRAPHSERKEPRQGAHFPLLQSELRDAGGGPNLENNAPSRSLLSLPSDSFVSYTLFYFVLTYSLHQIGDWMESFGLLLKRMPYSAWQSEVRASSTQTVSLRFVICAHFRPSNLALPCLSPQSLPAMAPDNPLLLLSEQSFSSLFFASRCCVCIRKSDRLIAQTRPSFRSAPPDAAFGRPTPMLSRHTALRYAP